MFKLVDKITFVTGGGSGIGRAICQVFARQGAIVYIADLDEKGGNDTQEEITREGGRATYLKCDVSSQNEVKAAIALITAHHPHIHILVNNAGVAHIGNAENTGEDDFDRLMRINVKGAYNCLHEVIPFMKEKGGSIVNMASVVATVGIPDRFAYSTTKGAIAAMSMSVAKDYIRYNIRSNSISPGRVHTPFVDGFLAKNYPGKEQEMFEKLSKTQPIGRMARPEEIAALALYLCSEEASFITGCDYPIDGGFIRLNN